MKRLLALSLTLCLGSSSSWAAVASDHPRAQTQSSPTDQTAATPPSTDQTPTDPSSPDTAPPDTAPPDTSSVSTASPNRIPAAEPCPTLARQFLIRGSYDSSDIGSRLWNLAKIHSASPQSDQEKVCLDEISKQANNDEADYWGYIAHKYKCDNDQGDLPKTKPSACPDAKWKLISGSVNWLNALNGVQPGDNSPQDAQQDDANCHPSTASSFHPQLKTATDVEAAVQGVPGSHPETPEQTVDTHTDLGTILAQPTANACSFVTDRTKLNQNVCNLLYKDDKNCGTTPSIAKDAGKCVEGLAMGIVNNIKDLFVDTAKMIGGVGTAIWHFLEAYYKGGRGTVAREYAFHPKAVLQHVWDALKGLPDAIMNMAATQSQTWQCYNNAARWDMSCRAVSYMGMLALEFVPGFQELAITQLSKIQKFKKAIEVVEALKEATVGRAITTVKSGTRAGLALLAEGAIVTGETTFKVLKWIGKATATTFKKLTWFRDSATGLMVAEDGPEVVVKIGENIEQVTSAPIRTLMAKAIDFVKGNRSLAKVETNAAKSLRQIAEEDAAGKKGMQLSLDFNPKAEQMKLDFDGAAAKTDEGAQSANAAHAGTSTMPKPGPEAVAPEAGAAAEAPKPGFFRRALNNYKDPDRKIKAAEVALSKKSAALPKSYIADDPVQPSTLEEMFTKTQAESERAAGFLGMKPVGDLGRFAVKDAKGIEQTFQASEDANGIGWLTKGKLPERLDPEFVTNIDIPPEKMGKALPGILARAEARGAQAYKIGGSSRALESGGRLTISFKSAKEAKRFQQSVEFFMDRNLYSVPARVEGAGTIATAKWMATVGKKIVSVSVMRPMKVGFKALNWGSQAVVESTALACVGSTDCKRHVITSETVFQDAKTKCKNDNLCICKLYFQAGINPDTDEPIETSPFTCTTTSVNPNKPGDDGESVTEVHKEMIGPDGKPIILQTTDHSGESDDSRAARLQKEFNDAAQKAADDPNGDVQPDTGPPIGPPPGQTP